MSASGRTQVWPTAVRTYRNNPHSMRNPSNATNSAKMRRNIASDRRWARRAPSGEAVLADAGNTT